MRWCSKKNDCTRLLTVEAGPSRPLSVGHCCGAGANSRGRLARGAWPAASLYLASLRFTRKFMPFYEYQCKICGHALEAMKKVNDSPLKKCPECGKPQLTRLMSAPVFRLKGGGWYETDFKGGQDNKKNLAERPEADAPKDDKSAAVDAK